MNIKEFTNNLYVEVYACNNEGMTMVVREVVGETGVHGTYLKIHNMLMNLGENIRWEIDMIRTVSLKSSFFNKTKKEEE